LYNILYMWQSRITHRFPDRWRPSVGYEYRASFPKKQKLQIIKRVILLEDKPLLNYSYKFTVPPKAKPKADKKSGKNKSVKLKFCPRLFIGLAGEIDHSNLFIVPTTEKIVKIRYNKPFWVKRWNEGHWNWHNMHFGTRSGFIIANNDQKATVIAIIFNPAKVQSIWTGVNTAAPRVFLPYLAKTISSGKHIEYGFAVLVGDRFGDPGSIFFCNTLLKPGTESLRIEFNKPNEQMSLDYSPGN